MFLENVATESSASFDTDSGRVVILLMCIVKTLRLVANPIADGNSVKALSDYRES